MTACLRLILLVVRAVSFVALLPFLVFGLYEELNGPEDAKQLLKRLKIPLSYKWVLIIAFADMAIFGLSHVVLTVIF